MLNAPFLLCFVNSFLGGLEFAWGFILHYMSHILHTTSSEGIKKLLVQDRHLTGQQFHRPSKSGCQHSDRTGLCFLQFLTSILLFLYLFFKFVQRRLHFPTVFRKSFPLCCPGPCYLSTHGKYSHLNFLINLSTNYSKTMLLHNIFFLLFD